MKDLGITKEDFLPYDESASVLDNIRRARDQYVKSIQIVKR